MSALVTSDIFRQYVNTLTPDEKYSRRYMKIFLQQWLPMTSIPVAIWRFSYNNLKRLYLKKVWLFFDFFLHFWNVHKIYKILKKKKSILVQLLPKSLHPKEMFT